MPGNYAVLAPVYDVAGLSSFAESVTPALLNTILQRGWMGRSILELGSGTGLTLRWIKQQGYNVSGVDSSPEMIQQAQKQTYAVPLYERDVRRLEFKDEFDLVIALNLLNELDSLRDLEATFKGAQQALKAGQMFVFDLQTLEGLARGNAGGGNTEHLFYDSPDSLTIFTRSAYDYERQIRTIAYLIFHQENGSWQRSEAVQTLRGYPIQAVLALLQRTGFELTTVLTSNFSLYDPNQAGIERVFVVAKRV